jgi:heparan-alpha-glucosaminide N-acetyltransferase
MTPNTNQRQLSVDIYRGFVMFLLLPDMFGGFSFYEIARRFPDNPAWAFLARQFSHAPWSGMTVWDFIMPSFVFLAGVAMSLSVAARKARGEPTSELATHVCVRAAAMLVLSLILRFDLRTRLEESWPLAFVLALGLPIPRWAGRLAGAHSEAFLRRITILWDCVVLLASASLVYIKFDEIRDHDLFGAILTQLALVTPLAFVVAGRRLRMQAAVALGILGLYWLAFATYPVPGPGFDLATVGLRPGDELFHGFFAHWNKGTNFASAFDLWFLNVFPRSRRYLFNDHGLQTLNFIPTVATMIFGLMAGDVLRSDRPKLEVRNVLIVSGMVAMTIGLLSGWWVCPIVKSIWTPSWAVFSGGITTLTLGILYHVSDVRRVHAWGRPLTILGTNSILLYTVAAGDRWWPLVHLNGLLGGHLFDGELGPLYESLVFLAVLWIVAFLLYRMKIFIKF